MKRHGVLVAGATSSLLLLAALVLVQATHPSALSLPSPWFVVAVVPLFAALVAGGYVRKLKASSAGLEVETLQPTKPPRDSELPSVADSAPLPPDYLYLNHTSFLREECQERFRSLTGVKAPHYDIRVVLDSYYRGALRRVERVEYVLHSAYPQPIQVRTNRSDRFLLKELANGEYVLLAKAYITGRPDPMVLQRYISLWPEGPRLDA